MRSVRGGTSGQESVFAVANETIRQHRRAVGGHTSPDTSPVARTPLYVGGYGPPFTCRCPFGCIAPNRPGGSQAPCLGGSAHPALTRCDSGRPWVGRGSSLGAYPTSNNPFAALRGDARRCSRGRGLASSEAFVGTCERASTGVTRHRIVFGRDHVSALLRAVRDSLGSRVQDGPVSPTRRLHHRPSNGSRSSRRRA